MIVTDILPPKVSPWNRQTYQRLKQALKIGLRRQIFVAVCDDFNLRNRLAEKLRQDLRHPKIVNLNLNLSQPNIIAQIAQWFAQQQQPAHSTPVTTFQILGVELLTRQPAAAQRLFLRHLQTIENNLSRLDSSILIWVPRPWFYTIQESAPEFWRWHTGIFQFEGEPTPVPHHHTIESPLNSPQSFVRSQPAQEETAVPAENVWEMLVGDLAKIRELSDNELISHDDSESQIVPVETPIYHGGKSLATTATLTEELPENQLIFDMDQGQQTLDLIAQLHKDSGGSLALAETYLQLGNYYRDRIEQGDASPENLMVAIQAYQQAVPILEEVFRQEEKLNIIENYQSESSFSIASIAEILNDVGNLYWMLSRCNSDPEHIIFYIQQAIQSYQLGLLKIYADTAPDIYAMIQNNLGAAYGDLARYQDIVQNLEQSIRAYQEAIYYRSPQVDPLKYASTQNNLGTAYWHLAQQQQPLTNLKLAISSYNEAIANYQEEQEPLNWAMIQNNLGTVYWNLSQYEDPTNYLHLAIYAYQNGLKYRTSEVAPAACASTQNNLGTAYWHLASQYQSTPDVQRLYLDLCIVAYDTAILLAQQLAEQKPSMGVSFDLLSTYNNLGLAQYQLATNSQLSVDKHQQSAYLEASLNNHLQALKGFGNQPEEYESTLLYVIQTIRAFYQEFGIKGQNLAFSKIPSQLLSEVMRRL